MTRKSLVLAVAALAAGTFAWLALPALAQHDSQSARAAAVVVLTMGLFATGALPEYLTSLLFFLLAMLLAIAPPAIVFSGFASNTLWLVFGGLIVAEAVAATGLGRRLAALLLRGVTPSYPMLVTLTVALATALAFVMPATLGRILLLLPVVSEVAAHAGLKPGGRGHNGVILAAMMGTYQCGTAVLSANTPNLVLTGAAENLYRAPISYAEYLMVQFPVMGLLKAALIIVLACVLFGEATRPGGEREPLGAVRGNERRLAVILGGALVLWATDFLHGIQPGWIALAAGLCCVLPGIGVIPFTALNEKVRVGPVFYIAAVLGLGATLSETGLAQQMGGALGDLLALEKGRDFVNFLSLSLLASMAGLLTTNPVQPAVLAPLAGELASAMDWTIKATLMTFAVGFTTVILPYQVPPVAVGLQVAKLPLRTALRFTLPLAALSLLLLVPLDYAWWKLIGYLR